ALAGFVRPDRGRIKVAGRDVTRVDPGSRGFGLVFQGYALFPHLSVFDNIAFPLRVRRWSKDTVRSRVEEMLDLIQLHGLERRLPRQLSGGQQQRVACCPEPAPARRPRL